jgi:hypothetical protein
MRSAKVKKKMRVIAKCSLSHIWIPLFFAIAELDEKLLRLPQQFQIRVKLYNYRLWMHAGFQTPLFKFRGLQRGLNPICKILHM